jgi:hypothetical protein
MTLEQFKLIEEKYIDVLLKKMDREDTDASMLQDDMHILQNLVSLERKIKEFNGDKSATTKEG